MTDNNNTPDLVPPHRFYFALTNFCNRSCEYCSCHSDPTRQTHLGFERFKTIISTKIAYEAQLEGGEPTIAQDFAKIVDFCQKDEACKKVILCTNAVKLPLEEQGLFKFFEKFNNKPFVLKPSINSHLIRHSSIHMEKMVAIANAFKKFEWKYPANLVFNVRRIPAPLVEDSEQWIVDLLKEKELYTLSNDFFYQRYGQAEDVEALQEPFVVSNPIPFDLVSPDGELFKNDLKSRAIYMKKLD